MLTGKQAQGKPLISITDGKEVGRIKDLYLDETLNRITGIFLGSEGLLNRRNNGIERAHIQLMGIDAWLLTGSDVIVSPENINGGVSFVLMSDVRGREIVSEGGTQIGAVDDVLFDENGTVLGFSLTRIQVKGTLADRKTIARSAISTLGGKTAAMTANMTAAETSEPGSAPAANAPVPTNQESAPKQE